MLPFSLHRLYVAVRPFYSLCKRCGSVAYIGHLEATVHSTVALVNPGNKRAGWSFTDFYTARWPLSSKVPYGGKK